MRLLEFSILEIQIQKNLMDYVFCLEKALKKEAKKNFMDIQPGDIVSTRADTEKLEDWIGFGGLQQV